MSKKRFGLVLVFVLILATSLSAQIKLLHSFTGATSDGTRPLGSVIFIGSTLYGMTGNGGTSDKGTIFKINTNGTGFTLLHRFAGGATDGKYPNDSLIVSGSTLYGMTVNGGTSDGGTIFKINTNGTGFALLHSFAGAPSDGKWPGGSLILSGSTFYGMTRYGGNSNYGTIFKINMDGTGFVLLHSFSSATGEGYCPYGSLVLSGSTLYGMTGGGGASYGGTIFKINMDGTGFARLHTFGGTPSDGKYPMASLILSGSTLYGMTGHGGLISDGTIFKLATNGTGFTLLHSFVGAPSGGKEPLGSLILSGSTLYGMTYMGGANWDGIRYMGAIFKININGTGFALIYSFGNIWPDGAYPQGSLILSGSTLYGMTFGNGVGGNGTIFKINTDGTGYATLHSFAGASDGGNPQGSLILIGSTLYGMTSQGGINGVGSIFQINTDGTGLTLLYSFEGGGSDGANPEDSLILSGSKLCGMTLESGASGQGVIFSYQLPVADIALTKSSDNIAPHQGAQFNFTVGVKDNGPLDATGLEITDKLPTGLTYVSSAPSTGTYSSSTGVWAIGSLLNGAAATLTLTVKASGSGKVTNTASVSALNELDAVTSNNSASSAVTILIPCTITTNYTGVGLKVTVDGTAYTLPQTSYWTPGTSHTLSVSSPQSGAAGTRYVYYSWSDSGAQTHSITVPASATTYTVYFSKQYSLTTIDNPLAGGTITPAGTTWYTKGKYATIGQSVVVQATSKAGYIFTGWSGSLAGWTNPATVVMNGPMSITGNFASGSKLLAPVLVQPSNGATGQPTSVTLTWKDTNSSPQELHYKVRIKPTGGAYKNYTLAANTTSYITATLLANKTYYWNVQALGNGTTIKTSAWANGGVDFKFKTK